MWIFGCKGESGYSARSTAEEVTRGVDGSGLVAIITGASSGIGVETTRVLALCGVHVVMAVRNVDAGKKVKEEIIKKIPNAKLDVMELDLSSMLSVRKFASEYNSSGLALNLLINNAGIMATPFMISQDKIELQFATNHIGHFLLTNLLLDTMKKTVLGSQIEGRIVILSSEAHKFAYSQGIRFDKINDESGYKALSAYGQSKLSNILHANELSRRLKDEGVNISVNSIHPGVINTNLLRHHSYLEAISKYIGGLVIKNIPQAHRLNGELSNPYAMTLYSWNSINFLFSIERADTEPKVVQVSNAGAATTCYVALNPKVKGESGQYFMDSNKAKTSALATDEELAKKLWDLSMNLLEPY